MRIQSFVLLILGFAACAKNENSPGAAADSALSTTVTGNGAEATLVKFLDASREGYSSSHAVADSLRGCQMADGMYLPIEMLATFHVIDSQRLGDTLSARAEVVTVAEEDGDPHRPSLFVATQRVKYDTARYKVIPANNGRWVLCEGPQFGSWGSDATTKWQPAGASYATARKLADSLWQASKAASRP